MKLQTKPEVNWNKAPFNMDNKISKEVRNALCNRFEVAINNLRDYSRFDQLKLKDGWVIKSKTDVVFVLVPNKDEDIPNNADLKDEEIDAKKYGQVLREARDNAFDLEKYSELAKVKGLTIDPTTGKISVKVI